MRVFTFPAASFARLMEGLNKLPTWTVYPSKLAECIKATTLILQNKLECVPVLLPHHASPNNCSCRSSCHCLHMSQETSL